MTTEQITVGLYTDHWLVCWYVWYKSRDCEMSVTVIRDTTNWATDQKSVHNLLLFLYLRYRTAGVMLSFLTCVC